MLSACFMHHFMLKRKVWINFSHQAMGKIIEWTQFSCLGRETNLEEGKSEFRLAVTGLACLTSFINISGTSRVFFIISKQIP